jgi:aspartate kinase
LGESTDQVPTVVKYGGAALDPQRWDRAVGDLLRRSGPLVVVVSARGGVTDLLLSCLTPPFRTVRHVETVEQLRLLHPGIPPAGEEHLLGLQRELKRLRTAGRATPEISDRILPYGERLAAHWFAGELERRGRRAQAVEADRLGLMTDGSPGDPRILLSASARRVRRGLTGLLEQGILPVVTGFVGISATGRVTTLGRGGSDYSATAIAHCLRWARVELVKQGASLRSADPRLVPAARPVERLSFDEAEELAQFGAKVLHPRTMEPARAGGMEVIVRSLEDPDERTVVGPRPGPGPLRAITLLGPVSLLLLRVPGGRQRKGILAEVSLALSAGGVTVATLYTSSALLCVVVEAAQAPRAQRLLQRFSRAEGASLEGPLPAALVTAIGEGLLADLGRLPADLPPLVLGASATSRTLSLAVPEDHGVQVLRALHRTLVEGREGVRP